MPVVVLFKYYVRRSSTDLVSHVRIQQLDMIGRPACHMRIIDVNIQYHRSCDMASMSRQWNWSM